MSRLLPLSKIQKLAIHFAPQFFLTLFSLCVISPTLLTIAIKLGLSPELSVFVLIAGTASAFGLVYGFADWPGIRRISWCVGLIALQVLCLKSYPVMNEPYRFILQALFWTSASLNIVQFVHIPQKINNFQTRNKSFPKVLGLPKAWTIWLLLQFARNKSTVFSYLSGIAISLFFSLLAAKENLDPSILNAVLALVVGSAVADMRGLQAVKNCFGIVGLQGTSRFITQQVIAGVFITILLSAPLTLYLASQGASYALEGVTYGCLGLGIGITIGTIVVPQNKDISSQLYASLLIIILTFVVQRCLNGAAPWGNLLIGGLLLLFSTVIEQYRNNFIWRKI